MLKNDLNFVSSLMFVCQQVVTCRNAEDYASITGNEICRLVLKRSFAISFCSYEVVWM